jgi:hypothetical protein
MQRLRVEKIVSTNPKPQRGHRRLACVPLFLENLVACRFALPVM